MSDPLPLHAAVEGITDEAVLRRLLAHLGGNLTAVHCQNGKPALLRRLPHYNQAARHAPWIVLLDLDRDADCAPAFLEARLPSPAPLMCLRIAVRAVEAWLLADALPLASFLSVSPSRIPSDPDALEDPKRVMVDLARASRRRPIRQDMVPRPTSGRPVGPAYASRLIEFTRQHWRPDQAARRSESLRRAISALTRLLQANPEGRRT
ncbi:MAG: hypothetical protein D6766_09045 [Verrucomicrobia bacterium]|nr:MAG: hypothetical protein D6766_09045 [Verrucomicrobiota bacterium]